MAGMFGFGILTWIKLAAVLLLVGSLAWLVDDYQYQKGRVEALTTANEALAAAQAASERTIRHLEAQHAAYELATQQALDRRTAEADRLAADLDAIREAPDNANCPVHPAILRSLDLLRAE